MEGKQQHLLYRIHVKIKAYNSPSNSNIMLATKDIKYFLEFKLKKKNPLFIPVCQKHYRFNV